MNNDQLLIAAEAGMGLAATVAASANAKTIAKLERKNAQQRQALTDTRKYAAQLAARIDQLEYLELALDRFHTASETLASTLMGALSYGGNFEELRPFGGMKPLYGIKSIDNPSIMFFQGPCRALGMLAGYVDQYEGGCFADDMSSPIIFNRSRFDNVVLPLIRGAFHGHRLFAYKEDWATLRKAILKGDLVCAGRRWDAFNGVSTIKGMDNEESEILGIGTLNDFGDAVIRDMGAEPLGSTHNYENTVNCDDAICHPWIRFERLYDVCERGRTVYGTCGSNDLLYASHTWWTFIDNLKRAAGEGTNYVDQRLTDCLLKLSIYEIYACMPQRMRDIALAIGLTSVNKFYYAVTSTSYPASCYGFSYICDLAPASLTGKCVAMREYLQSVVPNIVWYGEKAKQYRQKSLYNGELIIT